MERTKERIIANIKADVAKAINGINTLMYLNDMSLNEGTICDKEHANTFDHLLIIKNDMEVICDYIEE